MRWGPILYRKQCVMPTSPAEPPVPGDLPSIPALLPDPRPESGEPAEQVHLVVVRTRNDDAGAGAGPTLVARFWHPREHRWLERGFESLEHAKRVFVSDHGWALRQEQSLDRADAHELIFEGSLDALMPPSAAEILEDEVGLGPGDIAELLERVDRQVEQDAEGTE